MGFTALTSYSFYKPAFSSLVTSFKAPSDKQRAKNFNAGSLSNESLSSFNNNFFLHGEKSVKVQPTKIYQSGFEGSRKGNVDRSFSVDSQLTLNEKNRSKTNKRDGANKLSKRVRESAIVTSCEPHQFHEARTSKSSSKQSGKGLRTMMRDRPKKTKEPCQEFCQLKRYETQKWIERFR